jgi:hypothetical protein
MTGPMFTSSQSSHTASSIGLYEIEQPIASNRVVRKCATVRCRLFELRLPRSLTIPASYIHHVDNKYKWSRISKYSLHSHNMPISSADTSALVWEPGTTIELVALVVTLPGAIAALATLWIILSRRRRKTKSWCLAPAQLRHIIGLKTSRDTIQSSHIHFFTHLDHPHRQRIRYRPSPPVPGAVPYST